MKLIDRLWGHIALLCFAAAFVGFVGAAILSDGSGDLRGWLSALSGWAAAAAAVWIGQTQLRPLVEAQQLSKRNDNMLRAAKCLDYQLLLENVLDETRTVHARYFALDEKTDIGRFVENTPEMQSFAACEGLIKRIQTNLRQLQIETLKLPIHNDSDEQFRHVRAGVFKMTSAVRHEVQVFRNEMVKAYNEDYVTWIQSNPDRGEKNFVVAFLTQARKNGNITQFARVIELFENSYKENAGRITREVLRLTGLTEEDAD